MTEKERVFYDHLQQLITEGVMTQAEVDALPSKEAREARNGAAMAEPADEEAIFRDICERLEQAKKAPQPAPAPARPWHEHNAFEAMEDARFKVSRARDALAGIAAMLQPATSHGDEQMNMTHRSDAAAVFEYFAENMREPLETLDIAANMLQSDLRAGHL